MAILRLNDSVVYLNEKKVARIQIENDGDNGAERLKWWNVGDPEHDPSYITSDQATIRALEKYLDLTALDIIKWHKERLHYEAQMIILRAKREQEEENRAQLLADQLDRVEEIANDTAADYPNYPLEKYTYYGQYAVVELDAGRRPESFKHWHDFIDPPF